MGDDLIKKNLPILVACFWSFITFVFQIFFSMKEAGYVLRTKSVSSPREAFFL